jgi:uncharacterized phage infection (PIP) family protein YhgE
MDPSEAALASISELQKRIRLLEYDNRNLRTEYESLRDQLAHQESEFASRATDLSSANARAEEMLSNVSNLLKQIGADRRLNAGVKEQIARSELIHGKQRRKNARLKKEFSDLLQALSDSSAQVARQESILGDILAPPKQSAVLSAEEVLLLTSGEVPDDLMPPELADLHEKLRELPKIFHVQELEKKREVVDALARAKTVAQQLSVKIRFLEKRKFASSAPRHIQNNAKTLARRQCVICNDMKQFNFG